MDRFPGGKKEKYPLDIPDLKTALLYAEQDIKDRWKLREDRGQMTDDRRQRIEDRGNRKGKRGNRK
jgi:hypothetical protein